MERYVSKSLLLFFSTRLVIYEYERRGGEEGKRRKLTNSIGACRLYPAAEEVHSKLLGKTWKHVYNVLTNSKEKQVCPVSASSSSHLFFSFSFHSFAFFSFLFLFFLSCYLPSARVSV